MHIKSIKLTDVRSFKNAEIEFSKNINLLVGNNNSGKSTIIKSVYRLQNTNSLLPEDIRMKRAFSEIAISVTNIDSSDREKYFGGRHPLGPELTSADVDYKIWKSNQEAKYRQLTLHPEVKTFDRFGVEVEAYEVRDFFGFASSEDQNNFIYPFFSKRKISRYSSQGSGNDAYSVLDTFQNLPAKVQKTASQFVTKDKYTSYCKEILGFEVTAITGGNNDYKLGVYSGFNDYIPIESMGEGVVNIVGLITILLTEDNRLFLIEELENDIHPTALKKLLNLIIEKSDRNQFIISTHSNIVLKHLGSVTNTKVFFTQCDPIGSSGINLPTSIINEVPNTADERIKLLEQLGYDLFDFDLYKGYIIFEESSAEQIVRDFIMPFFFKKHLHLIRTIAAQGASDLEPKFNDLHRLFLFVHTTSVYKNKAWVIADGDETGTKIIDQLRSKFKSWPSDHFQTFKKLNFEEYYPETFKTQVAELEHISDKEKKRGAKAQLLKSVIDWMHNNQAEAKLSLESDAKDVIEKIGKIVASL